MEHVDRGTAAPRQTRARARSDGAGVPLHPGMRPRSRPPRAHGLRAPGPGRQLRHSVWTRRFAGARRSGGADRDLIPSGESLARPVGPAAGRQRRAALGRDHGSVRRRLGDEPACAGTLPPPPSSPCARRLRPTGLLGRAVPSRAGPGPGQHVVAEGWDGRRRKSPEMLCLASWGCLFAGQRPRATGCRL